MSHRLRGGTFESRVLKRVSQLSQERQCLKENQEAGALGEEGSVVPVMCGTRSRRRETREGVKGPASGFFPGTWLTQGV